MYIVDTLRGNVEKCVSMFADTVMHPLLQTDEIEESSVGIALKPNSQHILDYENEDSMMKRDYSAFSMDVRFFVPLHFQYLHAAMYGMKTPYGHPLRYHNPNLYFFVVLSLPEIMTFYQATGRNTSDQRI